MAGLAYAPAAGSTRGLLASFVANVVGAARCVAWPSWHQEPDDLCGRRIPDALRWLRNQ